MDRRLSRRKPQQWQMHRLALTAAALLLAVPGLSACGFNFATDKANTIANGASNQDGEVDVLNALIVSAKEGSGTFIATLANNDDEQAISLEALDFGADSTISVADFSPIEVPAHGLVNLSDGQGIKVSGEFRAGEFIEVTAVFDNGESAPLDVQVVAAEDEYTGLDNGTGTPAPAE